MECGREDVGIRLMVVESTRIVVECGGIDVRNKHMIEELKEYIYIYTE